MNLKQMMEAALKAAREIALKAKSEGRDLTADEVSAFDQKMAEVDDLITIGITVVKAVVILVCTLVGVVS